MRVWSRISWECSRNRGNGAEFIRLVNGQRKSLLCQDGENVRLKLASVAVRRLECEAHAAEDLGAGAECAAKGGALGDGY